jgi:rhamnosyltransferase
VSVSLHVPARRNKKQNISRPVSTKTNIADASETQIEARKIAATLVAFNPDTRQFEQSLSNLKESGVYVTIVNNGNESLKPIVDRLFEDKNSICFIQNEKNLGIASALNTGIKYCFDIGFENVLLLDHDTLIEKSSIDALTSYLDKQRDLGQNIGVVGPVYHNSETGRRVIGAKNKKWNLAKINLEKQKDPIDVDFIITSGSLLSRQSWDLVGKMDESLFIDLVDLDWCLRARSKNLVNVIVPGASIQHSIGNGRIKFWRWNLVRHSPERNYYYVRNAMRLVRRPYVPMGWKLFLITRALGTTVISPTALNRKWQRLRLCLKGIKDGLAS